VSKTSPMFKTLAHLQRSVIEKNHQNTHTKKYEQPALPGMPTPQLPLPLLFDLTDPRVKNNAKNHMLKRRAFSFFSTDDEAEIQLGGVDPASITGTLRAHPHTAYALSACRLGLLRSTCCIRCFVCGFRVVFAAHVQCVEPHDATGSFHRPPTSHCRNACTCESMSSIHKDTVCPCHRPAVPQVQSISTCILRSHRHAYTQILQPTFSV